MCFFHNDVQKNLGDNDPTKIVLVLDLFNFIFCFLSLTIRMVGTRSKKAPLVQKSGTPKKTKKNKQPKNDPFFQDQMVTTEDVSNDKKDSQLPNITTPQTPEPANNHTPPPPQHENLRYGGETPSNYSSRSDDSPNPLTPATPSSSGQLQQTTPQPYNSIPMNKTPESDASSIPSISAHPIITTNFQDLNISEILANSHDDNDNDNNSLSNMTNSPNSETSPDKIGTGIGNFLQSVLVPSPKPTTTPPSPSNTIKLPKFPSTAYNTLSGNKSKSKSTFPVPENKNDVNDGSLNINDLQTTTTNTMNTSNRKNIPLSSTHYLQNQLHETIKPLNVFQQDDEPVQLTFDTHNSSASRDIHDELFTNENKSTAVTYNQDDYQTKIILPFLLFLTNKTTTNEKPTINPTAITL
jgi:hypothetical protein